VTLLLLLRQTSTTAALAATGAGYADTAATYGDLTYGGTYGTGPTLSLTAALAALGAAGSVGSAALTTFPAPPPYVPHTPALCPFCRGPGEYCLVCGGRGWV
jgi:hypothetical protein